MLDLPTFLLIIGIGNLSFAGLMAAYTRGPIAQPALSAWLWARVILGIAQIASCFNLQLGSPWLGLIISTGWFVGMALEVGAYCLFFRFTRWRRFLYPATALSIVIVVMAQASGATVVNLIPVVAVILAMFAGVIGTSLVWPRTGTPGLQRVIGINDLILSISLLAWAGLSLRADGSPIPGGTAIQSVAFMAGYVLMIVKGFGFLLLCKQEDDRKMLHLATVDSLTGVLNRYAFFKQAQGMRAASITVFMLDLDHFKQINDRFGHAAGDDALCLFAQTVQTVLAGRGVIGRLGGEEFALALAAPFDEAMQIAEAVRAAVTAAPLATVAGPCLVTVSIGVALLQAGEALATGLARADLALYGAKHAGRNRVAVCAEVDAARGRGAAIAMAGQHDAILLATQAREQICA